MKAPQIQFDPGATATPNPLKWALLSGITTTEGQPDTIARFAHRDDAELFAEIVKRRPHRSLTRELRP